MNLLLLSPKDFIDDITIEIKGRRFEHIKNILKSKQGDLLSIGVINGLTGQAVVAEYGAEHVSLRVNHLNTAPPPTLPLTLILGLPRPKMLQRTLQTIATMGVEHLCLIHTDRVEKSFWQTPLLKAETVEHHLLLGLEQAKATQLPKLSYYKTFNAFKEDAVSLSEHKFRIIAHPGDYPNIAPVTNKHQCIAAIGPEGGFIKEEVDFFLSLGYQPRQIGQRILRVETAVPVVIGKLF